MGIGNIGWTEFLVILAFALIFFGPRRLPGVAQAIGRSLREFQKALNEVKSEISQASQDADTRHDVRRILPRPAELLNTSTPQRPEGEPPAPQPAAAEPEAAEPDDPSGHETAGRTEPGPAADDSAAGVRPEKATDGNPRDPHI